VSGLEDSVTLEEVVTAVAQAGGCCAGEVNTHRSSWSLGSVWIRCPLTAATKINGSTGGRGDAPSIGKLRIGWTPLPKRGLQCYKCLELGHYKSTVNRSDLCYRCGIDEYRARDSNGL
jgi:hypothetical protein